MQSPKSFNTSRLSALSLSGPELPETQPLRPLFMVVHGIHPPQPPRHTCHPKTNPFLTYLASQSFYCFFVTIFHEETDGVLEDDVHANLGFLGGLLLLAQLGVDHIHVIGAEGAGAEGEEDQLEEGRDHGEGDNPGTSDGAAKIA